MIIWDEHVADYLRLRRQLGFTLAWDEHLLGQFTELLDAAGTSRLTTAGMVEWAGLPRDDGGAGASRAATRMKAVRSFAIYMNAVDPVHEVPPRGVFSHQARRSTPYIYTPDQITALLEAAAGLRRFERSRIYPVVFGLLAATGMRVGELLALDDDEVDLDTGIITVSRGKSRDPRLIPLHETTKVVLTEYAVWRDQRDRVVADDRTPFFTDHRGRRLTRFTTEYAFEHVRETARLTADGARPRMHDLRHTFAVTTLLGWYRSGADVAGLLPRLSTYLGHTNPANTYWYLSTIPELLAHAARMLGTVQGNMQEAGA
ncbi:tyrosine-type recombinase/integrase [Agromyces neolithicus]|uniref:Tyrosine-type recombinase/integrase n=1 Tax=Agromyces neolithicus TaxID=269420 RepID=A0ABP4YQV0_9MICO